MPNIPHMTGQANLQMKAFIFSVKVNQMLGKIFADERSLFLRLANNFPEDLEAYARHVGVGVDELKIQARESN